MTCEEFRRASGTYYDTIDDALSRQERPAYWNEAGWTAATLCELWLCSRGIVPAERGTDDWWIGYRLWLYKNAPALRNDHYALWPGDRIKRVR